MNSGIAVGPNRGFPVTKVAGVGKKSKSKGHVGRRTKMVRELVKEICGLMPYEKRLLDMIKTGGSSSEKRMYKFAKLRLGTHKRAVKKRQEMKDLYTKIRTKQIVL